MGAKQTKLKGKAAKKTSGVFERMETYLGGRQNWILYSSLALTALFGILLFDIRFSIAGDDSAYVERAYYFIRHFVFPSFQGPLYPIVLSPLVGLFGISALPLKGLSLICMLGFVYFLYKSLLGRIPFLLLSLVLILVPFNSFIQYYSSQTYSEAFFMFLQSVFLLVFFKMLADEGKEISFMRTSASFLLLAAMVLALGLTRPIGFASAAAISAYYILSMKWKDLLLFAASMILVILGFQGIKYLLWGPSNTMFLAQAESFMAKDYYDIAAGREDFAGYVNRLVQNTGYYLSNPLYEFLGIGSLKQDEKSFPAAILALIMLLSVPVMAFRKNKYLLFTAIYILISLAGIFLITQTMWIQGRYIISYFPLILLLLLSFLYFLFSYPKLNPLQFVLPLLAVLILLSSLKPLVADIHKAREIKDKYSGLNPDWENYCRASDWAAKSLPPDALVGCRKPSVAFIYSGGKPFFGVTKLQFYPCDPVSDAWKQGKKNFFLIPMASVNNKPLTQAMFEMFSQSLVGWGLNTKGNLSGVEFLIMDYPPEIKEKALAEMKSLDISGSFDYSSMDAILKDESKTISMVYPDSLLNFLRKNKVSYLLTDNFRVYSDRRNVGVTGTIARYIDFIGFKHPGMIKKIMQIGADDNEPAAIWELQWAQQTP